MLPNSAIVPTTAYLCFLGEDRRVSIAAFIDVGFALYESLMTSAPLLRFLLSILIGDRSISANDEHKSSNENPIERPVLIAARAFVTLWTPGIFILAVAVPHGETIWKLVVRSLFIEIFRAVTVASSNP